MKTLHHLKEGPQKQGWQREPRKSIGCKLRLVKEKGKCPYEKGSARSSKKYGVTLASVLLAAGVTIGAVIGTITNALKKLGTSLANGLKAVGSSAANALPGIIGAIAKFIFNSAASAIGFLAEHTWLLILAVVAFLFQKLMKKN